MAAVKGGDQETRRYRSAVREEGARRTRRAVVVAATELFQEQGYGRTTLAQVAARAGVARPTVTAAFGSKPALLAEALDEALAGDDDPIPVAERPWFQPVWDAGTPQDVLAAYARVCTVIGGRAGSLFEVLRRAADASPELVELWDRTQRNRRAGARMVVDRLHAVGAPKGGRAQVEKQVDALWFYNDPAHHHTMVSECGWRERDFTTWLAARMVDALLSG
jgi:AcrR family transcriptional regulator